ncbi:MAG: prepilin peptidase [Candidatus Eremiobacteraeota bacterium]|nr:prepilin peptidase [Candidatus Eremiobacteraeota bacterium]
MTAALWFVLAACFVAGFTDIRRQRIPNWLTLSLAVGGVGLNALAGWRPFFLSLAVMTIILLAGTLVFSARVIGGGDIKLMAAASAALNYPDCVPFLLYTIICGGVLAIFTSAVRGQLRATLTNVAFMVLPLLHRTLRPTTPAKVTVMPYAVAIGLGALTLALSKTIAPHLRIPL